MKREPWRVRSWEGGWEARGERSVVLLVFEFSCGRWEVGDGK